MRLKLKIQNVIMFAYPLLEKVLSEKILPKLKKRAYEHVDSFIDDRLEDLSNLLDKAFSTDDPDKKEKHLKGAQIGSNAMRLMANKILEACDVIDKEIKEAQ